MATQTTGSMTTRLALWLEPAPPRRFCLDLHSNPWDGVLRALGAVEWGGGGGSFLFPLMAVSSARPPVQLALHRSPACPSFPLPPREIVFYHILFWPRPSLTNTNNKHFIDEHFIGWAFEVKPHFCQLSMVPSPGFAGTEENWALFC